MKIDLDETEEVQSRAAVEAAGIGTWDYNPLTGERTWSRRCKELFDLPPDTEVTHERFLAAIHPDDRERWQATLNRSLDPLGVRDYRVEYRTSGRPERWVSATGRAFFEGTRCVRIIGTVSDVTEQKRAEREREIFLGALGHDLRVPLNAISMGAGLLLRHGTAETTATTLAQRILSGALRMDRMIQDLLDFASSRTGGGLQLHAEAVDLVELCREVIGELTLSHPGVPIDFRYGGELSGRWDRDRLEQVVENLIANALQHGTQGTPILVTLHQDEERVVFAVANEGPEIPGDLRLHIFDPYRRGTNATGGLGLGLYIVREIVSAHRGAIALASKEGQTTFRVELPKI